MLPWYEAIPAAIATEAAALGLALVLLRVFTGSWTGNPR